jgi:hypothetical protein
MVQGNTKKEIYKSQITNYKQSTIHNLQITKPKKLVWSDTVMLDINREIASFENTIRLLAMALL